MSQLWDIFLTHFYLPYIVCASLLLWVAYVLVRISLNGVFNVRLPRWWGKTGITPLAVASAIVVIVFIILVSLHAQRSDWDHQFTAKFQTEAKSLSFKVYMPDYVPISPSIFQQALPKTSTGILYFFTSYGVEEGQGLEVTEFKALHADEPCKDFEPDRSTVVTDCEPFFTSKGVSVYRGQAATLFATIGDTRIVVQGSLAIDGNNLYNSSLLRSEMQHFFDSLHQVDATKLEYIDKGLIHSAQ